MQGSIENTGFLKVFRATEKYQFCPHQDTKCGDWCPLFSENNQNGKLEVRLNCAPQVTIINITKDERV